MNQNTDLPMEMAGVILCGGQSSRMGYPKANLPFGDQSLLRRVIDRLRLAGLQTIVLAAAEGQQLPEDAVDDVHIVYDAVARRGPLEAIRNGLQSAKAFADSAFVTSCDAPFLAPQVIRRLIELFATHEIVVPVEERFAHVLTAVYRCDLTERIDKLISADQMRPLFLVEQSDSLRIEMEQLRDVDPDLQSFVNMNQASDYVNALAKEGLSAPPEIMQHLRNPS